MGKIYKSNLFFLYLIVGTTIGGIFLGLACNTLGINDIRLRMFLSHFVLIFIPSIIFVKINKGSIKETFKLKTLSLKDFGLILIVGLFSIPMSNALAAISSLFFENTVGNLVTEISTTPYVILLLLIAVMPSITEEVSMRGVILSGYKGKSILVACIMNGILFGLFHLNAHQFIYATVLGFVLAYAVRVTGSLFASMIIHFMVNGTAVTMTKLLALSPETSTAALEEATKISPEVMLYSKIILVVVSIIIATALLIIILNILKKIGKRNEIELNRSSVEDSEKILNLPLVVSVVCYFLLMITISL